MSNFIASISELNELMSIFSKHKLTDLARKIEQANNWKDKDGNKILHHNIEGLNIFGNKFLLENDNAIKDLYEYTKNKSFNIAHFLECKIHNGHFHDVAFNGYVRLIKNTDYGINNTENMYKTLERQDVSTNKIFWNMVTLATYIKDNTISTKAFHLILNEKREKMYSFGLLDLEKIKRIWDRRFKGVDTTTLPQSEYDFILQSFNEINVSKTKSFCTTTSGHYLDVFIDINLISQENRLSKGRNNSTLTGVLHSLAAYVDSNKDTYKTLSINKIIIRDEDNKTLSFNAVFYYSDLSQQELIKSLVGELIDYVIVKKKDGKLQGESIKSQKTDQFFSSLIMSHSLDNTLDKKEETKLKKNKI